MVAAALAFDFINGFHDAANSIATVVSTRVLTPFQAVLWAAFFNFIAFAVFELHVASTIGKGIVDPNVVDMPVIIGALGGAIAWNLLTWWWGLPSSSSHALVGGLIGAGVAKAGFGVLGWSKHRHHRPLHRRLAGDRLPRLAAFMMMATLLAPAPGKSRQGRSRGSGGSSSCPRRPSASTTAATTPRRRWASSWCCSTRKAISGTTFPTAHEIPMWIVLGCYLAMGLGTMSGGWRIVKTMGMRLTKLRPVRRILRRDRGHGGHPRSPRCSAFRCRPPTPSPAASSGVGSLSNRGKVRWGVAGRIVWAWVFTIPAAAAISAITYFVARALGA